MFEGPLPTAGLLESELAGRCLKKNLSQSEGADYEAVEQLLAPLRLTLEIRRLNEPAH